MVGSPKENPITVNRAATIDEFEAAVYGVYPNVPLRLVGFRVFRSDKVRRLSIVKFENVGDLILKLGKAKAVLVPNRDLPLPDGIQVSATTSANFYL